MDNKRIAIVVAVIVIIICVAAAAVAFTGDDDDDKYTVTFESNGGSAVDPVDVDSGKTITAPSDPVRNGYEFSGWYSDTGLQTAYDFSSLVDHDLTLYAKWSQIFSGSISESELSAVKNAAATDSSTSIVLTSGDAKVELDSSAIQAVSEASAFTVTRVTDVSDEVKAKVGEDALVYDIDFGNNTDFGTGTLTISLPYTAKTSGTVTIYYLDEDGFIGGKYTATCDGTYAVFTVDHLSTYAISTDSSRSVEVNALTAARNFAADYTGLYSGSKALKGDVAGYVVAEGSTVSSASVNTYSKGMSSTDWNGTLYTIYFTQADNAAEQYANLSKEIIDNAYSFMGSDLEHLNIIGYDNAVAYVNDVNFMGGSYKFTFLYFVAYHNDMLITIMGYHDDGSFSAAAGMCAFGSVATDDENAKFINALLSSIGVTSTITIGERTQETVTFELNGGSLADSTTATVKWGQKAYRPVDPTRDGYSFAGWYTDSGLTAEYDFDTLVTSDITLYAKWDEATSSAVASANAFASAYKGAFGTFTLQDGATADEATLVVPTNTLTVKQAFVHFKKTSSAASEYSSMASNLSKMYTMMGGSISALTVSGYDNVTAYIYDTSMGVYTFSALFVAAYNDDILVYIQEPRSGSSTPDPFTGICVSGRNSTPAENAEVINALLSAIGVTSTVTTQPHTVAFSTNGGSEVASISVDSGRTFFKPTDPTRDGYVFAGWYSDSQLGTAYSFTTAGISGKVTSDITLYAKWDQNFTVTFDSNEGSAVQSQTVTSGKVAAKPADPTRTGYSFAGWYSDSALTTAYDFSSAVTADITLYAKWDVVSITVTFNSNEGSAVESQTVEYGKTVTKPADPTRNNRTFVGWYSDSALTTAYDFSSAVTADITLYAKWEITAVDAAHILASGYTGVYSGSTAKEGSVTGYSVPETATAASATAVTYSKGMTSMNSNGTQYTVYFVQADDAASQYAKLSSTIIDNVYTFMGSDLNRLNIKGYDNAVAYVNDVDFGIGTLSYKFTYLYFAAYYDDLLVYIIGYHTDGSFSAAEGLCAYGNIATDEDNAKFINALLSSIGVTSAITIGDRISYTVTFDSNGGSDVASQKVNWYVKATSPRAPTKEGHVFDGWYADAELQNKYDFSTHVTADTTLYAKWNVSTYTVAFDSNGGSAVQSQTVEYGKAATLPSAPDKTGQYFLGWYSGSDLSVAYDFSSEVKSDITLYAKWSSSLMTAREAATAFMNSGYIGVYNSGVTVPAGTSAGYVLSDDSTDRLAQLVSYNIGMTTLTEKSTRYTIQFESFSDAQQAIARYDKLSSDLDDRTIGVQPFMSSTLTHLELTGYTYADLWTNAITSPVTFNFVYAVICYDNIVAYVMEYRENSTEVSPYGLIGLYGSISTNAQTVEFANALLASLGSNGKIELVPPVTYEVAFDTDNGSKIASQTVEVGYSATQPADPTKEGYEFAGWYADTEKKNAYDFSSAVTAAITLYAKWTPVYSGGLTEEQLTAAKTAAAADSTYQVVIVIDGARIVLDSAAVQSLKSAATLSVTSTDVPDSVKTTVGDGAVAYEVTFGENTDFGTGKVTVSIAYTVTGGNPVVYYVKDGAVSETYNDAVQSGEYVTFTVSHFSTYVIGVAPYTGAAKAASDFANSYHGVYSNSEIEQSQIDSNNWDTSFTVSAGSNENSASVEIHSERMSGALPYTIYFEKTSDAASKYAALVSDFPKSRAEGGLYTFMGSTLTHLQIYGYDHIDVWTNSLEGWFTYLYLAAYNGDMYVYIAGYVDGGLSASAGLIGHGSTANQRIASVEDNELLINAILSAIGVTSPVHIYSGAAAAGSVFVDDYNGKYAESVKLSDTVSTDLTVVDITGPSETAGTVTFVRADNAASRYAEIVAALKNAFNADGITADLNTVGFDNVSVWTKNVEGDDAATYLSFVLYYNDLLVYAGYGGETVTSTSGLCLKGSNATDADNAAIINAVLKAVGASESISVLKDGSYTVLFETDEGSAVESETVRNGHLATVPESPVKDGYRFVAWYSDKELTAEYDFGSAVVSDITLYAKYALLEGRTITFSDATVSVDDKSIASGDKVLDLSVLTIVPSAVEGKVATVYANGIPVEAVDGTYTYNVYLEDVRIVVTYADHLTAGYFGDGVIWYFDTLTGKLTITGSGAMKDWDHVSPRWGGNDIVSVEVGGEVTSIGNYAFSGLTSLKSVVIGDSVTAMSSATFTSCTSLETVKLGKSLSSVLGGMNFTFMMCTSLRSIEVDPANSNYSSVDGGLYDRYKLSLVQYPAAKTDTEFVLPDTVTSISVTAFMDNHYLQSVTLPDSFTGSLGYYTFGRCTALTDIDLGGCTSLGQCVFQGCVSLKSIVLPDTLTSIGMNAFDRCTALTSIAIPESVKTIDSSAFSGCSSLTEIDLGSVEYINNYAFQRCNALATVVLPDTIKSLSSSAFSNAAVESVVLHNLAIDLNGYYFGRALKSISVDESNTAYTSVDGILFSKDMTKIVIYPAGKTETSYTIPDGVTDVGRYAFRYAQNLASVEIPATVTVIDRYAFAYSALTSIIIPDSVTTIDNSAFSHCSSLASVTFGKSVETIGQMAFDNCTSLTSVVIPDSVKTLGRNAFANCSALTTVVIGESVTSLALYTFISDRALTSVTIPASVTSIDSDAFAYAGITFYDADGTTQLDNSDLPGYTYSGTDGKLVRYVEKTVTFDTDEGSAVESQTVVYGNTATKPADPTKLRYRFSGWYSDVECTAAYDFSSAVTADITIYAGWVRLYTVSFESNGGSAVESQTVDTGSTVAKPTDPSRDGYRLTYWYTDSALTIEYNFAYAVTSDLALYAGWTDHNTVEFNSRGGSDVATQTLSIGDKATKPADPERSGYKFIGWYSDSDRKTFFDFSEVVTSDLTLYAGWVSLKAENALQAAENFAAGYSGLYSGVTTSKGTVGGYVVDEGSTATKATASTYSKGMSDMGASDSSKYTVTFTQADDAAAQFAKLSADLNGNIYTFMGSTLTHLKVSGYDNVVAYTNSINWPAFQFTFLYLVAYHDDLLITLIGYHTDGSFSAAAGMCAFGAIATADDNGRFINSLLGAIGVDADITIEPVVSYTVTFDSNGGSEIASSNSPQTVAWGLKAKSFTAPTKDGFRFAGWYKDADLTQKFEFSDLITSDTTLYAKWVDHNIVTFESNEGTAVEPQSVELGKAATKPADPTRSGYRFTGWYSDADLKTVFDFETVVATDITLYAGWIEQYTVTFDTDGGSVIAAQTVDVGSTAEKPADPTKAGYAFAGWYSDKDLTTKFRFTVAVTDNVTAYAKWAAAYAVTFNTNEGSAVDAQTVISGATATEPAAPTREGYVFAGWFSDSGLSNRYDFSAAVTADVTLYAKWNDSVYVSFDSNGGTVVATEKVKVGEKATQPTAPVRLGYKFVGWYSDEDFATEFDFSAAPAADITLYALWVSTGAETALQAATNFAAGYSGLYSGSTVKEGSVYGYAVGDGSTVESATAVTYSKGMSSMNTNGTLYTVYFVQASDAAEQYAKLTADLSGVYSFMGSDLHHLRFSGYDQVDAYVNDVDFTMFGIKFSYFYIVAYSGDLLTYVMGYANNGTVSASAGLCAYGAIATDVDNAKFVNALLGAIGVESTVSILERVVYDVTFDSNGGSSVSSAKVNWDYAVSKPSKDPTRDGYRFTGWYADKDCTVPYDFTAKVTGDITIYAGWTDHNTLMFNTNGGSEIAAQDVKVGDKAVRPADPTRTGYRFIGWYTDAGFKSEFSFDSVPTNDVTLYADWLYLGAKDAKEAAQAFSDSYRGLYSGVTTNNGSVAGYAIADGATATAADVTTYSKGMSSMNSNGTLYTIHFVKADDAAEQYAKYSSDLSDGIYSFMGSDLVRLRIVGYDNAIAYVNDVDFGSFKFTFFYFVGYHDDLLTYIIGYNNGKISASAGMCGYGSIATDTDNAKLINALLGAIGVENVITIAERVSCTVTFESNEGSAVKEQTVKWGQKASEPAAPTRTGYTFDGWYSDKDLKTAFAFSSSVTADMTLYAKWTINTYTATFESNEGSAVESQTVEYGKTVTKPADPTREHYDFGGWYSDKDLTTVYDFATAVTSDVTLYAKWSLVTFTVAFNSNEGSAVESQTVEYGKTVTKPVDPTRTGYVLDGWYSDEALETAYDFATIVTSDLTLYAKWSVQKFTATFEMNGGSAVESQTVEYGKTVTKPADPTREGATFEGWYSDKDLTIAYDFAAQITADVTIYAKWSVLTYTVTFNSNEGSSVESQTVEYGKTVTKPADPTRTGYNFGGWYSDEALETAYDFAAAVTSNLALYAKWSVITYTVTFNSNEGSAVESQTVEYGKAATKPADPTRTGYTFQGWFADEAFATEYDFSSVVSANTTVYAKWQIITYTVTFDVDEGSSVQSQTVEYGKTVTKPADPTRTDYTFDNWYSNSDKTTLYDFSSAVTSDLTLYAKWVQGTVAKFTVSFNSNEGSAVESQTVVSGNTAFKPADPTKEHYTFDAWYSNTGLTSAYDFSSPVTADITLYAGWKAVTYTVTFNSNEGSAVESQTVEYNKTATKPSDPTRTGYTFNNWYTDEALTAVYDFSTAVTKDVVLYAKWSEVITALKAANHFLQNYKGVYSGATTQNGTVAGYSLVDGATDTLATVYTYNKGMQSMNSNGTRYEITFHNSSDAATQYAKMSQDLSGMTSFMNSDCVHLTISGYDNVTAWVNDVKMSAEVTFTVIYIVAYYGDNYIALMGYDDSGKISRSNGMLYFGSNATDVQNAEFINALLSAIGVTSTITIGERTTASS